MEYKPKEILLKNGTPCILKSQKDLMVCAVVNGEIVANSGINPIGATERYSHRASLGISTCKAYWGLGIGSHLLDAIKEGARDMGYEQLELEVVCENARGLALYKKFGFQIYGTREHSFKYRDGSYGTAHLMMVNL